MQVSWAQDLCRHSPTHQVLYRSLGPQGPLDIKPRLGVGAMIHGSCMFHRAAQQPVHAGHGNVEDECFN